MSTLDQDQAELTPPMPTPRRRAWGRWALAGLVAVAIALFYVLGLHHSFAWDHVRAHLDTWTSQVRDHLAVAVLVFFLTYVAVTALSLPVATWLSLLAGALFGRWLGTAVVSVASSLGATLAFLGSRYLLRDWVQARFGRRLGPINRGIERDGAWYLFALRLTPVVPFFLVNLGLGLTPLRARTFLLVSWLGMLPATFLYVNAGTALATVESPRDVISLPVIGSLILLGIVPLVLRKLLARRS